MMVFEGDETIGMLTKQTIDGNTIYSFIYNNFEELDDVVEEGKEITLINDDNQLLCVADGDVEIIIENNSEMLETSDKVLAKLEKQKNKGKKVKKEKLPKDISFEVDERHQFDNLATEYNSGTSQINDIITNKFYINDRYHTSYYQINVPFDVYSKLKLRYYNESDNEPIGIFKWQSRMYEMLGLVKETIWSKMSYNDVVDC